MGSDRTHKDALTHKLPQVVQTLSSDSSDNQQRQQQEQQQEQNHVKRKQECENRPGKKAGDMRKACATKAEQEREHNENLPALGNASPSGFSQHQDACEMERAEDSTLPTTKEKAAPIQRSQIACITSPS